MTPHLSFSASMSDNNDRGALISIVKIVYPHVQGRNCHPRLAEAADKVAAQLAKYDGAASPPVTVKEGGSDAELECLAELAPEDTSVRENPAYDHDFQVPYAFILMPALDIISTPEITYCS